MRPARPARAIASFLIAAVLAVSCGGDSSGPNDDNAAAAAAASALASDGSGATESTDGARPEIDPLEDGLSPSFEGDGVPAESDDTASPDDDAPARTAPASEPATAGDPADDVVAVASLGGGMYLIDPDDGTRIELAADGAGTALHPVWRPDGRRLAWSLADPAGFAVMSANADGSEIRRADAPFGGYFGAWDPTGTHLAYLGNAAPGTGLILDEGAGATIPGVFDSDTFYFFSWSPDGTRWVVHSGSGFRIVNLDGTAGALDLDDGRFRAPVWTPDGSILLVLQGPEENVIVRLDPETQALQVVYAGGDDTNFVLDPSGRYLAVQQIDVNSPSNEPATTSAGVSAAAQSPEVVELVTIIDLETDERTIVLESRTAGLWWSPDGTRLAMLTIVGDGSGLVRWRIWSDGGAVDFEPFRLNEAYATAYAPFFDQFAQSVTPWSPDGSRFVYTGSDAAGERGVFVQLAEPNTPAVRIADDGILAFWSPT